MMTAIVREQTPPLVHVPSDKEKKYDRQLRLWAANGQAALENAHILLLNSGSGTVGVEALKNLVLPGIGRFTIADSTTVAEVDLGVNFFLDEDSLGKPRSQRCAELLQELNPDVKSNWSASPDINEVLSTKSDYTFVIYSHPISPQDLVVVDEYCQQRKIPYISVHSAGFYSYFHLHLPGAFPIVDTHPDTASTADLRLLSPWPELSTLGQEMTANIEKLDDHTHGHIPYVVLLLHYLEEWKTAHGGKPPKLYAEKKEFGSMVKAGARTHNPEGGEENYDEAVSAVLKNLNPPTLSSSVREVFEYPPSENEAQSSFWVITDAVKKFYAQHGALPLPGAVPDMKAQSEVYVRLQNIYKAKARQDVAEILKSVKNDPLGHDITTEEVETYCKNSAFVKLIRGNGSTAVDVAKLANTQLTDEFSLSPTLIPIYLALKASESCNTGAPPDKIVSAISELIAKAGEDERLVNAAKEVSRAQGGELHNISALTGGMIAQEVIKIITKQYIPIDNTCVYDGITSRTQVFKL